MPFDNIEIEIKVKIDESDYTNVKNKLAQIAHFVSVSSNIDTYFSPKENNYLLEKFPYKWLSIRQRNKTISLNYKHFHPEGAEKHTHCDEFETQIMNADAIKSILNELGFIEIVTVDKVREKYIFEDKYEIALDRVVNLGTYIEIEALKNLGDFEKIKSEMFQFLSVLGVNKYTIDHRGYPFQILKSKE
jgi:adenylate cyclase class 2